MYRGLETEMPSTNQAVKETANQILTYGGKPINALFFSSSGGYTDSSKEVWGTELPYIQPVPDFDQASPRYRWEKTISQNDLQTALRNLGHNIGTIREVRPLTFTPQKRVKTLELVGTQGRVTVDSNKFRFAAKLNSTLWTVSRQNGNPPSFRFDGGGWGHGLGMSQWGARQMAADGKSAEEIVKHYYTGIAIEALP
jgi:stage II sporulation protein D